MSLSSQGQCNLFKTGCTITKLGFKNRLNRTRFCATCDSNIGCANKHPFALGCISPGIGETLCLRVPLKILDVFDEKDP